MIAEEVVAADEAHQEVAVEPQEDVEELAELVAAQRPSLYVVLQEAACAILTSAGTPSSCWYLCCAW